MQANTNTKGITDYGLYSYRAYAVKEPLRIGPWTAWYEIHSPDRHTMLFGPIKLPHQFNNAEDAVAAAKAKVKFEIDHAIGGLTEWPVSA